MLSNASVLALVSWAVACAHRGIVETPNDPNVADGRWAVMAGAQHPLRMTDGNEVRVLVDGESVFNAVTSAIRNADSSIEVLDLAFEPTFYTTLFPDSEVRVADELIKASQRGVHVHILLDKFVFAALSCTGGASRLRDYFSKNAHAGIPIRVRDYPLWQPERLHAKALIVDGETAFVLGAAFQQKMNDTQEHLVDDSAHRGGEKPEHIVSFRVTGPAAYDVDSLFVQMWNRVDRKYCVGNFFQRLWSHINRNYCRGKDQLTVVPPTTKPGSQTVQILRTMPAGIGLEPKSGETEILEAYKRAFANAHRYIYVEHQYLVSRPIVDAIRSAMDRNKSLQVIAVVNQNPDQPGYPRWESEMIQQHLGYPNAQLGVYSVWSLGPENGGGKRSIRATYVEGKTAIVDDVWLTVGTGNLDGISLSSFEDPNNLDSGLPSWRGVRGYLETKRNVELNGAFYDGIEGASQTGIVRTVRCSLWTEHLRSAQADSICRAGPSGDWLALWNKVARDNVASLGGSSPSMAGRILPWVPGGVPSAQAQLRTLRVDISKLDVREDPNPSFSEDVKACIAH